MRLHRRCKAACLGTCPDYLQFETGRGDMLRNGTAALKQRGPSFQRRRNSVAVSRHSSNNSKPKGSDGRNP
jgi:hypothetical protein